MRGLDFLQRSALRVAIVVVAVSAAMSPGRFVFAQEPLVLSSIEDSVNAAIGEAILTTAYNRIGLAVRFELLPAKRASRDVLIGETDGEVQRIATFADGRPHLLRVDVPLFSVDAYIYSLDRGIVDLERDALARLRFGARSGIKFIEDYTRGFEKVFSTRSNDQLFRLLLAQRIDAAILSEHNAGLVSADLANRDRFVRSTKPAATLVLYHFLHRRHFGVVPVIESVFVEMAEEGTIDRLIDETLLNLAAMR